MLNAEIATGKRDEGLNDTEITSLLQKEVKSRKESAELYEKGGDQERANKELDEIKVIEEYLPKQMSDDELEAVVDEVLGGMSDVTPQMMGQVIGAVKQKVGASADGGRIAATVKGKIQK